MTSPPSDWRLIRIFAMIAAGFAGAWLRARYNVPVSSRRTRRGGGAGTLIGLLAGGLAASPWARNLHSDRVSLFVLACGLAGWAIEVVVRKRRSPGGAPRGLGDEERHPITLGLSPADDASATKEKSA